MYIITYNLTRYRIVFTFKNFLWLIRLLVSLRVLVNECYVLRLNFNIYAYSHCTDTILSHCDYYRIDRYQVVYVHLFHTDINNEINSPCYYN